MQKLYLYLGGAILALAPTLAHAQVVIDGTRDAAYGTAKSTIVLDASAPDSNFSTPTNASKYVSYNVYTLADASKVNFYLEVTGGTPAGAFANIYFDTDVANGNGSDIGFEVGNKRAFIAGKSGYSATLPGVTFADGTGGNLEFSIDNSLFTDPIAGLNYWAGQPLPSIGTTITARLLQFDGYSVNGGPSYGACVLSCIKLGGDNATGAVPEPATWLMSILGFGFVGGAMRSRKPRLQRIRFA